MLRTASPVAGCKTRLDRRRAVSQGNLAVRKVFVIIDGTHLAEKDEQNERWLEKTRERMALQRIPEPPESTLRLGDAPIRQAHGPALHVTEKTSGSSGSRSNARRKGTPRTVSSER